MIIFYLPCHYALLLRTFQVWCNLEIPRAWCLDLLFWSKMLHIWTKEWGQMMWGVTLHPRYPEDSGKMKVQVVTSHPQDEPRPYLGLP